MQELTLYYRPTCPFCRKVLNFMEENNITVEMKDISNSQELQEELTAVGGKKQIPCLVIDGKAMYESGDIVKWLGENNNS